MKSLTKLAFMGLLTFISACIGGKSKKIENAEQVKPVGNFYDLSIQSLDGSKTINMSEYKGKYIVCVNTASECGYTPQYKDLQQFYSKYVDSQIVVIGFPCNQFGGQEPGTAQEIGSFCEKNYGVNFPMTEKIDVKGDKQHPIYQWLTQKAKNGAGDFEVKWNFNKFVISPEGKLLHYFGSGVKPFDHEFLKAVGK
jgi:glutathione peroxidase